MVAAGSHDTLISRHKHLGIGSSQTACYLVLSCLRPPLGGAFRISCGTRQLDVSATLAKPQEITRLSPSFFDPVICPALSFESADELVISWSSLNTEDVFCGGVNKRKVSFQDLEGRASAIVGLLVARPGGIGSVQIDQKAQDDFSIAKHLRNILLRWR